MPIILNGEQIEVNPFSISLKLTHKHRIKKEYVTRTMDLSRDQLRDMIDKECRKIPTDELSTLPRGTVISYQRADNGKFIHRVIIIAQAEAKDGEPLAWVGYANNGYISNRQRKAITNGEPYRPAMYGPNKWGLRQSAIIALFLPADHHALKDDLEPLQQSLVRSNDTIESLIQEKKTMQNDIQKLIQEQIKMRKDLNDLINYIKHIQKTQ